MAARGVSPIAGPAREGFRYLKSDHGRAAADVLEENYRLDELMARPVIRDEFRRVYRVFDDWEDFWTWRDTIPAREQCFDEVVFGACPQHLKFDIDAPSHKIDAIPVETVEAFAGPIVDTAELDEYLGDYLDDVLGDADGASAALADSELDALLFGDEASAAVPAAPDAPPTAATPAARDHRLRQAKVDAIIGGLIDVILDELQGSYFGLDDLAATPDDLIVAESSGAVGADYKYSFHIIVAPYAVANNEEAKGFTARVLDQLPAAIRDLVDPQVNKSLQNFRLAGSSKPNSGRVKTVTARFGTADASREATVIRARPGARVLTRIYTEETDDGQVRLIDDARARALLPEITGEDLRVVLDAVARAGADAGHEYHRMCGELLLYRRREAGYCALCARPHEHDNTLMVTVEPAADDAPWPDPRAKAAHRVVEHCRKNRGKTRVLALVDLAPRVAFAVAPARAALPERQRQTSHTVGARVAAIKAGAVNAHHANATEFETLGHRQVYAEPQMRAYEAVPTLAVKGQMKLGKTKALRDYLDRDFPARPGALRVPVIRMVTFRQTFSKSMQRESFRDFELYSDHAGDLDHVRFPRLIVQVESLHRLRMGEAPEPIDLLILDEVESILAQFNSGLHRRFNAAFAMFQWMLATAARVVCMDANLGDRTLHVLQRMRPGHPITFHWNQFQRAADDQYYFTADQAVWLDHLFERIRGGQRVVLPTNSLAEARAFEEAIRHRHPDKVVRLYSSETAPSEKERHFADVHAYWSDLDVLLYTPTVSAGVSYELPHFDVLFGYFTDLSCDVETCRQMLARVRNIATGEHFVCLSGRANNLPTSVNDIRRLLFDKRANLYRTLGEEGAQLALQFEYGADGAVRFHESPYFSLWLETVRVENLSRNDFVARFIDQVADTGAAVDVLEPLPEADGRLVDIKTGQKNLKLSLAEAEQTAIAAAPDLDPEEAAAVRERLSRQEDVPAADRLGLAKYRLRDTYRWHGRPLDRAFVAAYERPEVSRVYKNLVRITAGATIVESLHLIQELEAGSHRLLMEARLALGQPPGAADTASVYESRDLNHRYVFQSHFFAVWLLRLCGFRCLTDRARIRAETMHLRIRAHEGDLLGQLEAICFEFQIRRPSLGSISSERDIHRYITKVLTLVNAVLRKMYGVEVKRTGKKAGGKDFYLAHTSVGRLFVFSDEPLPDDIPGGPKPHVPSRLAPVGQDKEALLNAFLDDKFYDDVGPRLAAELEPGEVRGAPARGAPARGAPVHTDAVRTVPSRRPDNVADDDARIADDASAAESIADFLDMVMAARLVE